MWRWTGFNLGLDLIVTYDRHCLSLKRNQVMHVSTFFDPQNAPKNMKKSMEKRQP